jgi:hypothetical protein
MLHQFSKSFESLLAHQEHHRDYQSNATRRALWERDYHFVTQLEFAQNGA